MCSNAFAFASANAAFALAFDCPVVDAFSLAFAFDSYAFALAFDSNAAVDWNQMRNKSESNETVVSSLKLVYTKQPIIGLPQEFCWVCESVGE